MKKYIRKYVHSDPAYTSLKKKPLRVVDSQFGPIRAYANDPITAQIAEYGNHTRPEFAFALAAMGFDMNVFDLGAHIGTFTLAALQKLQRKQRLLAVEGSPDTFSILRRNCAARSGASLNFVNGFVGESVGLTYCEDLENSGGSRLMRRQDGQKTVNLVSIDKLAKDYFPPDYIKIDIEGAEYDAFRNCEILRQRKPIIYIEISETQLADFGHSAALMNSLLQSIGYSFFVNIGDRNGRHDFFRVKEIASLAENGPFFDALCIPAESPLLPSLKRISNCL